MNREIKFRAYDTKNKKWLTAVPSLEYLLDDPDAGVSHHDVDEEMGLYFYPARPLGDDFKGRVVYQQYTGLRDKNDREIFEGDIIEIFQEKHLVNQFGFFNLETNSPGLYLGEYVKLKNLLEVVGNIFENEKLLTKPNLL